jgi:hypothetical protein
MRDEVVSETSRAASAGGNGHLRALTAEDGKLVHSLDSDRYVYYDARADPGEQRSIEAGAALDGLRARLAAWLDRHPSRSQAESEPAAADDHAEPLDQQLRALGYRE